MPENGGELTPGQRFARLEQQVERALKEISVERHRVSNILQIEKLHTDILATLKNHEKRLQDLEANERSDEAVHSALTLQKERGESNKRFLIGVVVLGSAGLLIQIVGLLFVLTRAGQ